MKLIGIQSSWKLDPLSYIVSILFFICFVFLFIYFGCLFLLVLLRGYQEGIYVDWFSSVYNLLSNCYNFLTDFFVKKVEEPVILENTLIENEQKISSDSTTITKKQIIIGVTVVAVVACGVGVGVFFIPGAPELIISTVLFCSSTAGFGGA